MSVPYLAGPSPWPPFVRAPEPEPPPPSVVVLVQEPEPAPVPVTVAPEPRPLSERVVRPLPSSTAPSQTLPSAVKPRSRISDALAEVRATNRLRLVRSLQPSPLVALPWGDTQ